MLGTIIIKAEMLRKPSTSPSGYRQATFNSFQSLQPSEYGGEDAKLQNIPSLMTKFVHLSSQLEIQNRISSFNLIDYDKDDVKMVFDQHLAAAKLKRIQNNAELKRANMELFLRKRKLQRIKQTVIKAPARKDSPKNRQRGEPDRPHKDLFSSFGGQNQQKKNQNVQNSFDEEFEEQRKEQNADPHPQGVKYFDFLKKHPKLLTFTLEKVKEKNMQSDRQKYQKRDRILKFRNQMRIVSRSEPRIVNQDKLNLTASAIQGPQQIVQSVIRKIYTKKNQSKAVSQAKNDTRLNSFIHKQEQILDNLNQKTMSKQNYKKLKERLDDLLTELYRNDKKHRIQQIHQRRFSKTPQLSSSQL